MTPRRPRWRRWVLRAALCLLLGAVTTVGVAWGCVLRTPLTLLDRVPDYRGLVQRNWQISPRPGGVAASPTMQAPVEVGPPYPRQPDPWAQSRVRWGDENVLDASVFGVRVRCASENVSGWGEDAVDRRVDAGWPLRALYLHRHDRYFWPSGKGPWPLPSEWRGWRGGRLWLWQTPPTAPAYRGDRFIPLALLWPGFVLNTLFFAAACGVLLGAPGFVRRRSRRRRGRCGACAYDLRGLAAGEAGIVCPECGAPGKTRQATALHDVEIHVASWRWLRRIRRGSIAVVVPLAVLGVVSGWWSIGYAHEVASQQSTWMVDVSRGRLDIRQYHRGVFRPLGPRVYALERPGRFRWRPRWESSAGNHDIRVLPLWAVVAPLMFLVAGSFWLERRWMVGRCTRCGYDLRGLRAAESSGIVCPECGTQGESRRS